MRGSEEYTDPKTMDRDYEKARKVTSVQEICEAESCLEPGL